MTAGRWSPGSEVVKPEREPLAVFVGGQARVGTQRGPCRKGCALEEKEAVMRFLAGVTSQAALPLHVHREWTGLRPGTATAV